MSKKMIESNYERCIKDIFVIIFKGIKWFLVAIIFALVFRMYGF